MEFNHVIPCRHLGFPSTSPRKPAVPGLFHRLGRWKSFLNSLWLSSRGGRVDRNHSKKRACFWGDLKPSSPSYVYDSMMLDRPTDVIRWSWQVEKRNDFSFTTDLTSHAMRESAACPVLGSHRYAKDCLKQEVDLGSVLSRPPWIQELVISTSLC